jgi:antirestriction protein ArdC
MTHDVYQAVTDRIIAMMESGPGEFVMPWTSQGASGKPLRITGEAYKGINVLLLWASAAERGYTGTTWMTYKQAQELGAHVRKGEKSTEVVYAATHAVEQEQRDEAGNPTVKSIPFLKRYWVFNVDQIDGLPDRFHPAPIVRDPIQLHEQSERFFAATGATVRHGGGAAFYAPGADVIQLPAPEAFRDRVAYGSTKAHEFIHWTGAKCRLEREYGKRFGDAAYAFEELVAELGAAFLCADLGLSAEPRQDHAAYLASWLEILKGDKRAIFTAASAAQKACEFLHDYQQTAQEIAA